MMKCLLIGSRAMRFWYKHSRRPVDYDFLVKDSFFHRWFKANKKNIIANWSPNPHKYVCIHRLGVQLEFETSANKSVDLILAYSKNNSTQDIFGLNFAIAKPDILLGIKASHIHYPFNWFKHIDDFHYLRSKNVKISKELAGIIDIRKEERARKKDTKVPMTLNITNDEFFNRSKAFVKRFFEHDDLHEAVKYGRAPLFLKAKKDKAKALLSRDLFEGFDFTDKCRLVREEAYVIALERILIKEWLFRSQMLKDGLIDEEISVIPSKMRLLAYRHALMRICTTLTKGWYRDFAIDHYPSLKNLDVNYFDVFLNAVNTGKLRMIDG